MKPLKRVVYGVLNWGLGHASRSSIIIEHLLDQGVEVCIASDGAPLELLKKQFPTCRTLELPSYNISYSNSGAFLALKVICQIPKMLKTIHREKQVLEDELQRNEYDLVISDTRFGLYSPSLPSVILNHQKRLNTPIASKWVNQFNQGLNKNFDHHWIPDVKNGLTDSLSTSSFESEYIGWLSNYKMQSVEKDIDILVVLSGPEPQRSILEKKLNQLISNDKRSVLVRGVNEDTTIKSRFSETYGLLMRDKLEGLLNRAKVVVSRSGYSSLMDYKILQLPAIIIPTPGQTEQEHLADLLQSDGQFKVLMQKELKAGSLNWSPSIDVLKQKKSPNLDVEALHHAIRSTGFIMPT